LQLISATILVRHGGGGGALSVAYSGATTMIVIGILVCFAAAASFCWLVFELAVYALPISVGVVAGLAASHSGAGPIGAVIVGLVAAVALHISGQLVFDFARSRLTSLIVGLVFAAPAAAAGYEAVHGLAALGAASPVWQQSFAVVGAILVGATAWARLSVLPPRPAESDRDAVVRSSASGTIADNR
jgi:hypothetical protein